MCNIATTCVCVVSVYPERGAREAKDAAACCQGAVFYISHTSPRRTQNTSRDERVRARPSTQIDQIDFRCVKMLLIE